MAHKVSTVTQLEVTTHYECVRTRAVPWGMVGDPRQWRPSPGPGDGRPGDGRHPLGQRTANPSPGPGDGCHLGPGDGPHPLGSGCVRSAKGWDPVECLRALQHRAAAWLSSDANAVATCQTNLSNSLAVPLAALQNVTPTCNRKHTWLHVCMAHTADAQSSRPYALWRRLPASCPRFLNLTAYSRVTLPSTCNACTLSSVPAPTPGAWEALPGDGGQGDGRHTLGQGTAAISWAAVPFLRGRR